jgi:AraC-like DNA-binding protein
MVVRAELERLSLHPASVELGIVELEESELTPQQNDSVRARLHEIGFELLEDRRQQLVEAIKTTVIELIHRGNDDTKLKHSEYLALQLGYEYPHLSKLFSDETGTTIEQYIILQKIEKVKELLTYGEQTISDIAYQLGYSSVAALSSQFKKVTGITPSAYKDADERKRKTLDQISS